MARARCMWWTRGADSLAASATRRPFAPGAQPTLSASAAYDLVVAVLGEGARPDDIEARLRGKPDGEWSVVEWGSGRLPGVVRAAF